MNKELGDKFEKRAEEYLISQSYKILDKNWHAGIKGEIDLVCWDEDILIFVEVKGRTGRYFLEDGFNSITPSKIRKIKKSIDQYIYKKNLFDVNYRFDILILGENTEQIEHFKNIEIF